MFRAEDLASWMVVLVIERIRRCVEIGSKTDHCQPVRDTETGSCWPHFNWMTRTSSVSLSPTSSQHFTLLRVWSPAWTSSISRAN